MAVRSSRLFDFEDTLAGEYDASTHPLRVTEAVDCSLFRSLTFLLGFSGLGSGQSAIVVVEGSTDQVHWGVLKTSTIAVGGGTVAAVVVEPVTHWARVRIQYYDSGFTVAFAHAEVKT